MNDFKKFLVNAKKNTYASNGEGGENRLDDGSKELIFKEGGFLYRDRYFGHDPFAGEEIVFESGKPIWCMNYYGKCLGSDKVPSREIYGFLKKALKEVDTENPYRGPKEFFHKNFSYKNNFSGNTECFYGEESICYNEEIVYELRYHGGIIN